MRIIVCGSRAWTDIVTIHNRLIQLPEGSTVITGGCRGADRIADELVRWSNALTYRDLRTEIYDANWERHGKQAGPIRNRQMLASGVDLVIAFHPNLSESKGTRHMVRIAQEAGVPVEVITG